jgi:endonuclease III
MWLDKEPYFKLHDLLCKYYGSIPLKTQYDPLTELIRTILTQNTADVNSERSFEGLKRRFKNWDEILSSPISDLFDAIKEGGLAPTKSMRIRNILQKLKFERGIISLDFLTDWTTEDIFNYLRTLPGVGDKTIGCVLMFSLHRPVFIVDTHVERIMVRLEAVPEKWTPDKMQVYLTEQCPDELIYELHLLVINHGRTLCRPNNPKCVLCPIITMCSYEDKGELK